MRVIVRVKFICTAMVAVIIHQLRRNRPVRVYVVAFVAVKIVTIVMVVIELQQLSP